MKGLQKVKYPFLHEQELREHIATLKKISARSFAPIACDQGSSDNYKVCHACDYAIKLINEELNGLMLEKERMYNYLDARYGERGKDYCITLDGTVHRVRKETKR